METLLTAPQGNFQLNRFPKRQNDTLRAWDAADELLLQYLDEHQHLLSKSSIKTLIINDQFGALSVPLNKMKPSVWSDSYISYQSIQANCDSNKLKPITFIRSTDLLAECYDVVIIKIQKSLAQLEDQLYRLRPHINENTLIVGCSMVKMLHSSTLNLFEKIIGPTSTSLAKKKARLIFSKLDISIKINTNPYPQSYVLDSHQWQILNHANVFSRSKLDIGCRFFIENIPQETKYKNIVDLGCGNGIVGMVAAKIHPAANVEFYDESYMAIASAEHNFNQHFPDQTRAQFNVDDCLSSRIEKSADLILNNPPFHQQNAIGDFIAWRMFTQSYKVLQEGGELWVIGNRHLQYHLKLKKLFGNCKQMVSNKKFVILRATKNS